MPFKCRHMSAVLQMQTQTQLATVPSTVFLHLCPAGGLPYGYLAGSVKKGPSPPLSGPAAVSALLGGLRKLTGTLGQGVYQATMAASH